MKNQWTLVLVAIVAMVIGNLFSKPKESVASKNYLSYSDTIGSLNEIDNRLSLLAAKLENQPTTKFEQAAIEQVAEVVKGSFDEYATKTDLSELRTELLAEIESRIPKPIVQAVKSATTVLAPANYQARWTHPGTIEDHMATDHGVSVAGKSKAQLLAEHDAIHDKIGPVYQTKLTKSSSYTSNCPGGVCPTPRAAPVTRFRVFRR